MAPKPTLVFVHGAWHSPECWTKITTILNSQGYKTIAPSLPSTLPDPSKGLDDDIEVVRKDIVAETTQGHDVVVIAHSYGSMVGGSVIKGLAEPKHQDVPSPASERSGHVIGLILIACGFVQTGMSFLGGFGGKPPPSWKADEKNEFAVLQLPPRQLFYHDLPEEEANYWVSKLRHHTMKSLAEGGEFAYAGWMDVPTWYLGTTEDQGLPIEAQRMLVQMAKAAGGDVTAREVQSSHSPMLSRPTQTADFIVEALEAFAKLRG